MKLSVFFFCLLFTGLASVVYFLLLIIGGPTFIALPMALIVTIAIGWYFKSDLKQLNTISDWRPVAIWFLGMLVFLNNGLPFAYVEGKWDAWAMWNLHAKYLSDTEHWRFILHQSNFWNSPDYPLHTPALIASIWSIMGTPPDNIVPFVIAFYFCFITISILFFALYEKNKWIACAVLFYFLVNQNQLELMLTQFADVVLACLMMASLVAMHQFKKDKELKWWLFVSGFCLGLACWTKNEGIIYSTLFLIFHIRTLSKKSAISFWIAFIIPISAFLVFKIGYAPKGYMAKETSLNKLANLFNNQRFKIVWNYATEDILKYYNSFLIFITVTIAYILNFKKLPRYFLLIFSLFLAYFSIYLFYDFQLDWQLATSFRRMMLQIEIPLLFVCGITLSKIAMCKI